MNPVDEARAALALFDRLVDAATHTEPPVPRLARPREPEHVAMIRAVLAALDSVTAERAWLFDALAALTVGGADELARLVGGPKPPVNRQAGEMGRRWAAAAAELDEYRSAGQTLRAVTGCRDHETMIACVRRVVDERDTLADRIADMDRLGASIIKAPAHGYDAARTDAKVGLGMYCAAHGVAFPVTREK